MLKKQWSTIDDMHIFILIFKTFSVKCDFVNPVIRINIYLWYLNIRFKLIVFNNDEE